MAVELAALFLSHTGMSEALGQSQVLPYLRGLAGSGIRFDLVACEPPETPEDTIRRLQGSLVAQGICYTALRRRPAHDLGAKLRDCAAMMTTALARLVQRRGTIRIIHARSHLPGAVAQALRHLWPGVRTIFDCRGLLAQEYVDMGHWRRGELRHLLTEEAERHLLRRADRVVVLTEAMRQELCGPGGLLGHRPQDVFVIPCCVDPDRFRPDQDARQRRRAELGLRPDQPLLCFSGSQARYDLEGALRLLAALRRRADARFLLLSRADSAGVRDAAARLGCASALHVVSAAPPEVPSWLNAADWAVALLRDSRSSIATSPTKIAECLAVGLPTVVRAGIGDAEFLRGPGLLPLVPTDPLQVRLLADELLDRWHGPEARQLARATALRHFSLSAVGVPRYRALYAGLA
ncbi:MAG: glycosyltransferase [Myxococcales bacterium]|nr:glycosyltransferase [Myxococcota bacterium]MDW8281228.1 glycosyltransferase [Myxococcales bacterium]